jgi:hypothetical protein
VEDNFVREHSGGGKAKPHQQLHRIKAEEYLRQPYTMIMGTLSNAKLKANQLYDQASLATVQCHQGVVLYEKVNCRRVDPKKRRLSSLFPQFVDSCA